MVDGIGQGKNDAKAQKPQSAMAKTPYADFAEKIFICPVCGEFESFAELPQILRSRKFTDFESKHKHEKK